MEDLKAILDSRTPLYAKAEIAISTTGRSPDEALAELLRAIAVPDNALARRPA
jgi:XRE family aerobic/anaerobic benzoate catabolism transcriptional regulator